MGFLSQNANGSVSVSGLDLGSKIVDPQGLTHLGPGNIIGAANGV